MSVKRLALLPLLGWVVPALPGDFSSGSLEVRAASGLPGSHECDVGVFGGGVSPPARWPSLVSSSTALLGFFSSLLKVALFQCFPALESALLVACLVVGSLRGGLACLLIGDVLELRRLRLQVTMVNPTSDLQPLRGLWDAHPSRHKADRTK